MIDGAYSNLPTDVPTAIFVAQRKYRLYYETCIKACRGKDSFVSELLILLNGPLNVPEKYRLWRCDGMWKEDGRPQPGQFDLDPPASFGPLTGKHPSGVTITLYPIVWSKCQFHFPAHKGSWDSVMQWQTKWLDENDKKLRDEFGLAGVIHWLSEPSLHGDHQTFLVDFGSAPVDAFHELLFALAELEVRELTVSSFGNNT
jgi:hypothetical protein